MSFRHSYLKKKSEQIQIRGRTARQGKKGSFMIILNAQDLVDQFSIDSADLNTRMQSSGLYNYLDNKRNEFLNKKNEDRTGIVERSLELHNESLKYRQNLMDSIKGDISAKTNVIEYLESQNPEIKRKSRIICLSDATGSMKKVWNNAKRDIEEMILRITKIGGVGNCSLKWIGYRDYSDNPIVECSPWSTDPAVLQRFISNLKIDGGGNDGPEAVEIGMQSANMEEEVTRVILIGDASPHLEGKGNIVQHFNKVLETDYILEANEFARKNINVHCFYMNEEESLVKSFSQIAEITGGKASKFSNANSLIHIISESVLGDIGGEQLIDDYRKTYLS